MLLSYLANEIFSLVYLQRIEISFSLTVTYDGSGLHVGVVF